MLPENKNAIKKDESKNVGWPPTGASDTPAMPAVVDRATFRPN
jgi:hypothetical protein